MDPPDEGCLLCGSTWGNVWEEIEGRTEFFCCMICARQWNALRAAIRGATGWGVIDRIDLKGNRWGRTGVAHLGQQHFAFRVVFTPEGALRTFESVAGPA